MLPSGIYILRCPRMLNMNCLVENIETGQLMLSSRWIATRFKLSYVENDTVDKQSDEFTLFSTAAKKFVGWKGCTGIGSFADEIGYTTAKFMVDDISSLDRAMTVRLANYHTGNPLLCAVDNLVCVDDNDHHGLRLSFEATL